MLPIYANLKWCGLLEISGDTFVILPTKVSDTIRNDSYISCFDVVPKPIATPPSMSLDVDKWHTGLEQFFSISV